LLLTTLWATGARNGEVLTLRRRDVPRQSVTLPNLTYPSRPVKTARLAAAHAGLPGELWTREHELDDEEPHFFSRQRDADGWRKAIDRMRAWQIVKNASERAARSLPPIRSCPHARRTHRT
jgi:hypothetical protein